MGSELYFSKTLMRFLFYPTGRARSSSIFTSRWCLSYANNVKKSEVETSVGLSEHISRQAQSAIHPNIMPSPNLGGMQVYIL